MQTKEFEIPVPTLFSLDTALRGHGWISLAPHRREKGTWETTLALSSDDARTVRITQESAGSPLRCVDTSDHAGTSRAAQTVAAAVSRMLRTGVDLSPFWRACRRDNELGWVARRRAGYLMASQTAFEDLLKILFTTNCSWSATEGMVHRTVAASKTRSPTGQRTFPSAGQCARMRLSTWKERIRCGYRAEHARVVAKLGADGKLDEIAGDPDPERRRASLLQLPGFGPYAAGQALRLLGDGYYEDLALDSWCRARLRIRSRADETRLHQRLEPFGEHAGLALWMLLTADWHGESSPATEADTQ